MAGECSGRKSASIWSRQPLTGTRLIPTEPRILVPLPIGTEHAAGHRHGTGDGKITERRIVLKRTAAAGGAVVSSMIARPVFSRERQALFHGDPHAGNLFLTDDGRLALLDWSLAGPLERGRPLGDRTGHARRRHARRRSTSYRDLGRSRWSRRTSTAPAFKPWSSSESAYSARPVPGLHLAAGSARRVGRESPTPRRGRPDACSGKTLHTLEGVLSDLGGGNSRSRRTFRRSFSTCSPASGPSAGCPRRFPRFRDPTLERGSGPVCPEPPLDRDAAMAGSWTRPARSIARKERMSGPDERVTRGASAVNPSARPRSPVWGGMPMTLTYRGYAIEDLAAHAGFEEVAYLCFAVGSPTGANWMPTRGAWLAWCAWFRPHSRFYGRIPDEGSPMAVMGRAQNRLFVRRLPGTRGERNRAARRGRPADRPVARNDDLLVSLCHRGPPG